MANKSTPSIHKTKLYSMETGASRSDEDEWTLVYNETSGDLFVEHWYGYTFGPNAGSDTKRIELIDFLNSDGYGVAELKERILKMFKN